MRCLLPTALAFALAAPPAAQAETLAEAIAREAQAQLPRGLGVAEVQAPSLAVEGAAVTWLAAARPGVQSVRVTAQLARGRSRTVWAQLKIAPLRAVVVAAHALGAGERLVEADLRIEERAADAGSALELEARALDGVAVLAPVPAGAIVPLRAVALPPPVPQGSPVTLLVRLPGVTATRAGRLERAARPGERAVALTDERRPVRGRLITFDTLLVEGGTP